VVAGMGMPPVAVEILTTESLLRALRGTEKKKICEDLSNTKNMVSNVKKLLTMAWT
jgi:hypothetical protein